MAILDLLKRINERKDTKQHPVFNKDLGIRRSFLLGLAMQAHADGELTEDERTLFYQIAAAFGINQALATDILNRSADPGVEALDEIRNNLLQSKHKYYFIIDLYIMAHQDQKLDSVETQVIEQFAQLLDVDEEEMGFLTDLAGAVISNDPRDRDAWIQNFVNYLPGGQDLQPQDFDHYAPEDHPQT